MAVLATVRPQDSGDAVAPAKPSHVRRDVQGLRAVAVLAVVLDHLLGWPSGGFVGVDVFFVISGFLITGLLLREHERTGRISFSGFYRRRIKRILPAATLVLAVTVAASSLLFATSRAVGTFWDAVWAFFFAANWRFASIGTDYFQGAGPTSPLQHYWSLSVEEQFYFVWPWLMLLVLWLGTRRPGWGHHEARLAAGAVLMLIVGASFLWALWETRANPTVAYFSTISRTWELGLGALAAVFSPMLARLPGRIRPVLAWAGLAGIVVSLFVVSESDAFPAPWAALPVLATVLVIVSGIGGRQPAIWPLTNRVSTYLGDISFSLYLWHFPVIILGAAIVPMEGLAVGVAVIVMAVLSVGSYHLVEDPIRRSLWLTGATPHARQQARAGARERRRTRLSSPWLRFGALAVAVLLNVGLLTYAFARTPPVAEYTRPVAAAESAAVPASAAEALSASITTALQAEQWPELTPDIRAVSKDLNAPEWVVDGCLADERGADSDAVANAERCVYGDPDAERQAVVVGDSIAISWMPGIRAALGDGWAVHVWTMQQCPAADVLMLKGDGSAHTECGPFVDWAVAEVGRMGPDLVIASTASNSLNRLASESTGAAAESELGEGIAGTVAVLAADADRVVVLGPVAGGANPQKCVTALGSPADCISRPATGYTAYVAMEQKAIESLALPNVVYQPTQPWRCDASGLCPAFIGSTPVTTDGSHLTAAFSGSLGPVLREVLLPT